MDTPRVLLIAGAGRSGSTALDTILGGHAEVCGVGELINLVRAGYVRGDYCACGERGNSCPFWGEVRSRWEALAGDDVVDTFLALQPRVEKLWRWLMPSGTADSDEFRTYAEQLLALYRAIADVAQTPMIVDSSKVPARAFALASVQALDLRVVHLVRDPRGVAWSLARSYGKDPKAGLQRNIRARPVLRSAAFWRWANTQTEWLLRRLPSGKHTRVRYEDLVSCPEETLQQIGQLFEVDYAPVVEMIRSQSSFETGHRIAGNRLRMNGSVTLRADLRWQAEMPTHKQRAVTLLAGPLLKKYGYAKTPVSASAPITEA